MAGLARAVLGAARAACRGSCSRRTTTGSATRSSASCRASRTTTGACASRAASCCRAARGSGASTRATGAPHFTRARAARRRDRRPGRFRLTTLRSHDQFNTTIYGHDDRYRGIHGDRRVVLLHARRSRRARASPRAQRVDLTSHFRGETRCVRGFRIVAYDVPRGCAAAYFPEANPLVRARQRRRGQPHADLQVDRDLDRARRAVAGMTQIPRPRPHTATTGLCGRGGVRSCRRRVARC